MFPYKRASSGKTDRRGEQDDGELGQHAEAECDTETGGEDEVIRIPAPDDGEGHEREEPEPGDVISLGGDGFDDAVGQRGDKECGKCLDTRTGGSGIGGQQLARKQRGGDDGAEHGKPLRQVFKIVTTSQEPEMQLNEGGPGTHLELGIGVGRIMIDVVVLDPMHDAGQVIDDGIQIGVGRDEGDAAEKEGEEQRGSEDDLGIERPGAQGFESAVEGPAQAIGGRVFLAAAIKQEPKGGVGGEPEAKDCGEGDGIGQTESFRAESEQGAPGGAGQEKGDAPIRGNAAAGGKFAAEQQTGQPRGGQQEQHGESLFYATGRVKRITKFRIAHSGLGIRKGREGPSGRARGAGREKDCQERNRRVGRAPNALRRYGSVPLCATHRGFLAPVNRNSPLERFNKYCSRSGGKRRAVFLASGFVFARLQPHWRGWSFRTGTTRSASPGSQKSSPRTATLFLKTVSWPKSPGKLQ